MLVYLLVGSPVWRLYVIRCSLSRGGGKDERAAAGGEVYTRSNAADRLAHILPLGDFFLFSEH